jgi:hypothetical protein
LKTTRKWRAENQERQNKARFSTANRKEEPETLKLKVVFSPETGIIDTGSFGFRTECPPTDRRSASARV